jgi:hypothetical protein
MFEISHDPFRRLDQALHEGGRLVQQPLFAGGAIRRAQFGLEVPVSELPSIFRRPNRLHYAANCCAC